MTALASSRISQSKRKTIPPLEQGDCLDQPTFHERYEKMGPGIKAELIEGVVHIPSPVGRVHSKEQGVLMAWLGVYFFATPGVEFNDNATIFLGESAEPQPDAALRLPGGTSRIVLRGDTEFIAGPPEFVAEVAASSESVDLHAKRRDYERHGIGEYLAFLVRSRAVVWFTRESGRFVELKPTGGILKSRSFPGLWLDPAALLRGDAKRMHAVLNRGLASREHSAFVDSLAKRKSPGSKRR